MKTLEEIVSIPAERVEVPRILSNSQVESLEGESLTGEEEFQIISGRNVDVYAEDTGKCLLKLRCGVLSPSLYKIAYESLKGAATASDNRGMAAGKLTDLEAHQLATKLGGIDFVRKGEHRIAIVKHDGTLSKVIRAKETMGGIAGFFGATARQPFCRQTAFTQKDFKRFKKSWPLLREVSQFYGALMPHEYAMQKEAVEKSSQDFVIPGTVFSTVTVNRNFPTACHYDAGDFEQGFGNLVVIRKGNYSGGYTCFPAYGVGVDAHNGDMLLMDVHQLHGNTPLVRSPGAVRLALVMYFREDVMKCGTYDEELRKARISSSSQI